MDLEKAYDRTARKEMGYCKRKSRVREESKRDLHGYL